jgi:hypothetical protein
MCSRAELEEAAMDRFPAALHDMVPFELYRTVFVAVSAADLLRLFPMGAPTEEYDIEVNAIVPQLIHEVVSSQADVAAICRNVFVQKFSEDLAGPIQAYRTRAWRVKSSQR